MLTKGRAALYSAQRALLRVAQLKLLLPDLPAARAVSVAAHNVARSPQCGAQLEAALLEVKPEARQCAAL